MGDFTPARPAETLPPKRQYPFQYKALAYHSQYYCPAIKIYILRTEFCGLLCGKSGEDCYGSPLAREQSVVGLSSCKVWALANHPGALQGQFGREQERVW
jgi:hypothetical protein